MSRVLLAALCCLLLAACGPYWRRIEPRETPVLPVDESLRIWHHGAFDIIDSAVITRDSVRGRGGFAIGRADVDSVKIAQGPGAGGAVMGALVLGIALLGIVVSQIPRD